MDIRNGIEGESLKRVVDRVQDLAEPTPFKPGPIPATQLYKETALERFIALLRGLTQALM